jgi:L-asparagine transporter-like permease
VFLFVDVLYVIRKFRARFEAVRIAHPSVFWVCAIVGAVANFFAVWTVFTNPFSTQLFSKADWWHAVLAITAISLVMVPILYVLGTRTGKGALPSEAEAILAAERA